MFECIEHASLSGEIVQEESVVLSARSLLRALTNGISVGESRVDFDGMPAFYRMVGLNQWRVQARAPVRISQSVLLRSPSVRRADGIRFRRLRR